MDIPADQHADTKSGLTPAQPNNVVELVSNDRTELYRHYDSNGDLLYVGISLSAVARLAQHRCEAHWFEYIARVDIEPFPTREAALEAEARAIAEESPKHNVARGYDVAQSSKTAATYSQKAAARAARAEAEAARAKAKAEAEAEEVRDYYEYLAKRIDDFAASLEGPLGEFDRALVKQAVLLTMEIERMHRQSIQERQPTYRKDLLQLSNAVTKIMAELRPKRKHQKVA